MRFLYGALLALVLTVAATATPARADVGSAWDEGRPAKVCTYSWDGFNATVTWWAALYTTTPGFVFTCAEPDLTLVQSTCYWYEPTFYACYDGNISVVWAPTYGAFIHEIGHALGLGHPPHYEERACYPPGSALNREGCAGQEVISPDNVTAVLLRILARAELRAQ